jgi:alkylhydroperoxidase/carboxymuconolactone decarboxylase family protein YurZ
MPTIFQSTEDLKSAIQDKEREFPEAARALESLEEKLRGALEADKRVICKVFSHRLTTILLPEFQDPEDIKNAIQAKKEEFPEVASALEKLEEELQEALEADEDAICKVFSHHLDAILARKTSSAK